ncbi:ATP-binding protein [Streptomyces lunaelactis]|uniref:ATP-binding protein n=1 Tax=Streptomyces lunaelactis TaxID=1535768 RepID=UPI0015857828|nr:ATP-binding protein [Streptomyces lunaelactis]NUK35537.1 ATP-binding protein [Streptomyces lunaelactis]NUK42433.1 ATP-binding protein [Streptomyces lunaelactis]NUK57545.1 ATP-binding protein [Streptomyces lunaelactis]NUK93811.1 ATP-binding protein [Streptomyces lunaelactis]NUL31177.1 ATP-binding protein [Streptomyces lunaelactis]
MSLTVEPAGLRAIRHDIASRLGEWSLGAVADDVVSVIVELLTNVFEHAEGTCDLEIQALADQLFVSVSDTVIALPAIRPRSSTAEEGRGLLLVGALTEHWETTITVSGKVVSCTFKITSRPTREGLLCHPIDVRTRDYVYLQGEHREAVASAPPGTPAKRS